jgi:hypothetical protein
MGETPRDLYLHQMRSCRPFNYFGITPVWRPGEGDIEGFIHDEVVRQFHDPRVEWDGGQRVKWMQAAWAYAMGQSQDGRLPDMDDILKLGHYIEPSINSTVGFRTMDVYIGGMKGAPPRLLSQLMNIVVLRLPGIKRTEQGREGVYPEEFRTLWQWMLDGGEKGIVDAFAQLAESAVTADDWYLLYEAVHPFGDGNGRSGKVLHNWLLGTLAEPVLVRDYFGGGNP